MKKIPHDDIKICVKSSLISYYNAISIIPCTIIIK